MLLCLALQILQCQCRCKADAKHMQNAACIAECRCRLQIALQNCRSENTWLRSQTACAPEALGRIQSLTRIPPGLGCWVEGPWRRSLQRGNVTNMVATSLRNGSKIVPKWSQHGCQMGPGGLLEASWRSIGALKEVWSAKWGPHMGHSWTSLGSLLGPKKVVLNGSWPLQEEFQERFQPSWGPKGSQKGGQEGPKSSPRGDSSSKRDLFEKYCFSIEFIVF